MRTEKRRNLTFHLLVLIPLLAACRSAPEAVPVCTGSVDVRSPGDLAALDGCERLDGDLRITGASVADLSGLEDLRSVRYLVIAGTGLRDLSGLSGLRAAEGITVTGNPVLASLRGLESVRQLDGLVLEDNAALTTVDGLAGLERADAVVIVRNPRLESLAGLSALVQVRELEICPVSNPALAAAERARLRARTVRPVAGLAEES